MYNTCRFEIFEVLVKLLRHKQEVDPKRGRNCIRARVLNATHLVVETCEFMILHFFISAMVLESGPVVCAAGYLCCIRFSSSHSHICVDTGDTQARMCENPA